MDLSAEEFAGVIKALGMPRLAAGDKRRANRVMHRCRTTISLIMGEETGERITAVVKDLSPRGVGLLLSASVDIGSQFVLYMTRRGSDPVRILCTVTNCREANRGLHVIGAEFTTLIARPVAASAAAEVNRIRDSILG